MKKLRLIKMVPTEQPSSRAIAWMAFIRCHAYNLTRLPKLLAAWHEPPPNCQSTAAGGPSRPTLRSPHLASAR